MVAAIGMREQELQVIADEVARSLSYAMIEGRTAYITTAVNYPNGTAVVVRIDVDGDSFFVSDDGQGALNAELFGANRAFSQVAPDVAKRFSVQYDNRCFFLMQAKRKQLPAAVALIANASTVSVDRTLQALDRQKVKASRELFTNRILEAFGDAAKFGAPIMGTTKKWNVDAAIIVNKKVEAVFEFVTPAPASVAFAHMKVGDITAMFDHPKTTVVLSDYDKTEAPLRQILSMSADTIIAAKSDISEYRLAA